MGVPMLALVWPASWLLLIPVVFLEAWVATRVLAVQYREGVRLATAANLFSTILGIPVTWVILLVLGGLLGPALGTDPHGQMARAAASVLSCPWVFPDDPDRGWQGWMVIVAAMILCMPFCLMSVAVEASVVRKGVSLALLPGVRRWAWQANLLSYGLIEVWLGVLLVLALRK
jgi:hypothetical protein